MRNQTLNQNQAKTFKVKSNTPTLWEHPLNPLDPKKVHVSFVSWCVFASIW